jgi:two-component system, LytTR family, sensor kinase
LKKYRPFPYPKSLIYYAGPWLMLPVLQTLVVHRLGLDWKTALHDSVVSNLILAFIGFETNLLYRFYQPGKENQTYRMLFGLVMAVLFCYILNFLPGYLLPGDSSYIAFLEASLPVRFVFALMVIFFITLYQWIRSQLTEQKEMERRAAESEQLMKEAELARLRQQLHPHFLFNSLNSINALIGRQPEAARKMTQQLSDFLRGTLKQEDKPVRLQEELDHLRLYLDIEKVRFGSRLQIEFVTSSESLELVLPALLLQPIVENAIKFGLYDVTDVVHIRIRTWQEGDFLWIEIQNPFDPKSEPATRGAGFGLSSVQRRLQLVFARKDLLTTARQDNLFSTTLRIPTLK